MTIYNDGQGNYFLGDCQYANHSIDFPTRKYLKAYPHNDIASELANLYTSAGFTTHSSISSQSTFDSYGLTGLGFFKTSVDNEAGDYRFHAYIQSGAGWGAGAGSGSQPRNILYTDNLDTAISIFSGNGTQGINVLVANGFDFSGVQWAGVANDRSLALFAMGTNLNTGVTGSHFWYMGTLADVNTNFNHYSADILSHSVVFSVRNSNNSSTTPRGHNFISDTSKPLLQTGIGDYSITCSDSQTPSGDWFTDFGVFDDNPTLGDPNEGILIGKASNLLLAEGTYTFGKPVIIGGSVFPDNGQNSWLPVGNWGSKTIMMRCYSS